MGKLELVDLWICITDNLAQDRPLVTTRLLLYPSRVAPMAEVEKDRVRAESGKPDMEEKVKKMMELNELREKWSDKLFQDNPDSVNSFMVTMDENNMPAIEIGVDPSASQESLAVPEELFSENLIFRTVERMRDAGPLILDLEDGAGLKRA